MVETDSEVKVKEKDEVERLLKNLKNMSLTALRRECQTNPPKGFNMKLNAKELRKMLKRKYLKEFPELAVKVFKEKEKPKIETTVDYLVVIDFECTCDRTDPDDKHSREPYLHEIIEFPVVIVDVSKKAIIAEFR
uniref:Exonuclease domain-containing protein n=1 Tax=Panagrolaimus sp. JU765 TaxID=591449 RepID=A0AC34RKV7_9BILA